MGTDRGVLHFFDGDTGDELMAFVPPEMFPGMQRYIEGNAEIESKPGGLDGFIQVLSIDENNNGNLTDSGDRLALLVGARRGANVYYGIELAVTANGSLNPGATKVTVFNKNWDPVFGQFGGTWARALISELKPKGKEGKLVALLAGGYDPQQDDYDSRNVLTDADSVGNVLAMISLENDNSGDFEFGRVLWYAAKDTITGTKGRRAKVKNDSKMTHSFPSNPAWVDLDGDSFREKFFVSDINGRIFRFDFDDTQDTHQKLINSLDGGLVADLAPSGSQVAQEERRRFYERPDVLIGNVANGVTRGTNKNFSSTSRRVIKLALGSGYRAHPLTLGLSNTGGSNSGSGQGGGGSNSGSGNGFHIQDRFYILAFDEVFKPADFSSSGPYPIDVGDVLEANESLRYWQNVTDINNQSAAQKAYDKKIAEAFAVTIDGSANTSGRKYGIYVNYPNPGEKQMSPTSTAAGQILFTTYIPPAPNSAQCELRLGSSRLYAYNAETFAPDPFWRFGSQPNFSDRDKVSGDFDAIAGSYEMPGQGFASVQQSSYGFSSAENVGVAQAQSSAGSLYRIDTTKEQQSGKANDVLLPRSYWQELAQ
jgi:Tfp pilus tip-associated adhesin PilY1